MASNQGIEELGGDNFLRLQRLQISALEQNSPKKWGSILAAIKKDQRMAIRSGTGGLTFLHQACASGNIGQVQDLLAYGAEIHRKDARGWDSLMISTAFGHLTIVELLLSKGAKANTRTAHRSALSWAASMGDQEMCILLLSRGANLMEIIDGATALDFYSIYLTPEAREQRLVALKAEFAAGPFHTQVKRRNWERRWPLMSVLAGCGFRPLAVRVLQHALKCIAIIEGGEILPAPGTLTVIGQVFSSEILRLIVQFL